MVLFNGKVVAVLPTYLRYFKKNISIQISISCLIMSLILFVYYTGILYLYGNLLDCNKIDFVVVFSLSN